MSDRKMMKWQPFDSVMNTKEAKNNTNISKNKITSINLSEEQLQEIEENIITAYQSKTLITVIYINSGCKKEVQGYIKKIIPLEKIIIMSDNKIIFFHQIIKTRN